MSKQRPQRGKRIGFLCSLCFLLLSLLLLPACSTQKHLTNLVKALANDPATVRLTYGPLVFERFVPSTNAAPLDLGAILTAAIQLGRLAQPGTLAAGSGAVPAQVFFQPQAIPLTALPLIPTNILFIPVPPPK